MKILRPRSNSNMPGDDFNALDNSLSGLGLSAEMREMIYQRLAAILHLGNVNFEDNNEDHAEIKEEKSVQYAASLLGIDTESLRDVLLKRKFNAPKNCVSDDDISYV